MKIPKYWAKSVQGAQSPDGRRYRLMAWDWSDANADEARQKADARVKAIAQKVMAGLELDRYGYGARALREEIIGAVNPAGKDLGVVTRNRYGALVLNASNAMFIDIDFPENERDSSGAGPLQRMLGAKKASLEERYARPVTEWASRHLDVALRVYRTFAGLRCLITNQLFDPSGREAADILRALNSDPLYIRLCQAQECFRARVTPKPWRVDMSGPPAQYPFENAASESRYRQWQQRYEQTISKFATCRLIQQIGPRQVHPEVEPILTLHDQTSGVAANQALA